jgi:hypothetical protein
LFFKRYLIMNPPGELPEGEDCVFRRPPVVKITRINNSIPSGIQFNVSILIASAQKGKSY